MSPIGYQMLQWGEPHLSRQERGVCSSSHQIVGDGGATSRLGCGWVVEAFVGRGAVMVVYSKCQKRVGWSRDGKAIKTSTGWVICACLDSMHSSTPR